VSGIVQLLYFGFIETLVPQVHSFFHCLVCINVQTRSWSGVIMSQDVLITFHVILEGFMVMYIDVMVSWVITLWSLIVR